MPRLVLCILLLFFLPASVQAHGGGEGGAPGETIFISATGSLYEVVLKAHRHPPGEEMEVFFLLSEYESNAPVKGASLEVEAKGEGGFRVSGRAKETQSPGVYRLPLTFPAEGEYLFDLTIQAAQGADLLVVSGFWLTSPEAASNSAPSGVSIWMLAGSALGALLAGVLGFLLGRASARRTQAERANERT